jgi:hypothetical protein
MNKKIFTLIVSVTLITCFVTAVIAVDKGLVKRNAISLPRLRVLHAEAEFKGTRVVFEKAICEDTSSEDVEPSACKVVSRKLVYKGEIAGFVNGTFFASGKAVNDRQTGLGYVEGKLKIYDSNGKLTYNGNFEGATERLPTITDTSEQADIVPSPRAWSIEGSIDLVGTRTNAGKKAFLNFDATATNNEDESTIGGKMDGVLILKMPTPIALPLENATE